MSLGNHAVFIRSMHRLPDGNVSVILLDPVSNENIEVHGPLREVDISELTHGALVDEPETEKCPDCGEHFPTGDEHACPGQ